MPEQLIGEVTHFFSKAHVAAIAIKEGQLRVGDTIHVVGHTDNFTQRVESMQLEHAPVAAAKAGENIGIQVVDHVHEHDKVYRVVPD
jgi:translation initiation factor IF-2